MSCSSRPMLTTLQPSRSIQSWEFGRTCCTSTSRFLTAMSVRGREPLQYLLLESLSDALGLFPAAESRLGRRMVLNLPVLPPPQKNRSLPSDSSPDTPTPGGILIFS